MLLHELEDTLSITFPTLFHQIYDSGMMAYLTHDKQWMKDHLQSLDENMFFIQMTGDCEYLPFEDIAKWKSEIDESISFNKKIKDGVKIIPFAHNGRGNSYCFLYSSDNSEPIIGLYDDLSNTFEQFAQDFEECMYCCIVMGIYEDDIDVSSTYIQNHVKWLRDNHQNLLQNEDIHTLANALPELSDITDLYLEKQ